MFPGVAPLLCNASGCNAPTAVAFVSAIATLTGYTSATFGSIEFAAFDTAMATQLSVPVSAVIITSVTDAVVSGRHLLATSIVVAYSVQTTVAGLATMRTAMAAPLSVAAFQSAGLTSVSAISATVSSAPTSTTPSPSTPPSPSTSPRSSGSVPTSAALGLAVAVMLVVLLA
jgi:hypothetical protein